MKNRAFSHHMFELFTKVLAIFSDQFSKELNWSLPRLNPRYLKGGLEVVHPIPSFLLKILSYINFCCIKIVRMIPERFRRKLPSAFSSHLHQVCHMIAYVGAVSPVFQDERPFVFLTFMEERFGNFLWFHQFRTAQGYRSTDR
jgi:hypothetical protein